MMPVCEVADNEAARYCAALHGLTFGESITTHGKADTDGRRDGARPIPFITL
jgi:hypothetical protein